VSGKVGITLTRNKYLARSFSGWTSGGPEATLCALLSPFIRLKEELTNSSVIVPPKQALVKESADLVFCQQICYFLALIR
jgi:hypothetical protein